MEKIRIGDACDILNGYAFKSDRYVDEGIRVIRIANVQKGYIEDNAPAFYPIDASDLDKYMLEVGDLLMSLTGNVGRVALLQKEMLPAALNQRVACLRLKTDRITKGFLFHILNSDFFEQQCIQASNGVAQKNMSTEWLKDYEIPLYSIDEQLKISEILDKARHIISSRKDELSALDDLIKARFVEFFGDRYVNDKNWNTTKLGESISFNNGKAHEQVVDENGEYILVTSRAIASDFEDVRRTNTLLFPLHKNDIVMVMSDVPNGKALAKCQLIDSDDKYTLNQRICSFDNYEYNPIFLLHLLNRHPYFLSFNDGNGQTNLRKNDILECELIVPPMELQEQFADFVHQVDKSKVAVQKSLDETQQLFDSLMQKYFG